jgi:hypothetical protein
LALFKFFTLSTQYSLKFHIFKQNPQNPNISWPKTLIITTPKHQKQSQPFETAIPDHKSTPKHARKHRKDKFLSILSVCANRKRACFFFCQQARFPSLFGVFSSVRKQQKRLVVFGINGCLIESFCGLEMGACLCGFFL